ncbi:hypothetical protein SAMN04488074_104466 [Lentzea albidocapillata subsp. violacea]|uniref:Uncharacterized protein n=1 Tax=Lentzea albidocapillata subsp. violacea TaxID=128104 RepID=A0A1G8ZUU4_9PSEU|nr:hypothetical protein SAMN04488074_104466 [Lentzea albidocapillata subsp. violacea]
MQVRAGLGVGRLAAAMESLVELHPELCRSGFAHHEVADPAAATPAALAEAEAGLDLGTGVLMHLVWLDAGPVQHRPDRAGAARHRGRPIAQDPAVAGAGLEAAGAGQLTLRARNTCSRPGRSGASRTSTTSNPQRTRLCVTSARDRNRSVESEVITEPSGKP